MNPIAELFNSIPEWELKEGLKQMEEDSPKGIYRENGIVRKYAYEIRVITHFSSGLDLFQAELQIYKQAAFRWLLHGKKDDDEITQFETNNGKL